MKPAELKQRVLLHNALQLFLGVTLIPVSICLWIYSFWWMWWVFSVLFSMVDLPGRSIGLVIACIFVIALAVEGVRYGKPLFEIQTYTESAFHNHFMLKPVFAPSNSERSSKICR